MQTKIFDETWKIWVVTFGIALLPVLGRPVFDLAFGSQGGYVELVATSWEESTEGGVDAQEFRSPSTEARQPAAPLPEPLAARTEVNEPTPAAPTLPSSEETLRRMREFLTSGNEEGGSAAEDAMDDGFSSATPEDGDDNTP